MGCELLRSCATDLLRRVAERVNGPPDRWLNVERVIEPAMSQGHLVDRRLVENACLVVPVVRVSA